MDDTTKILNFPLVKGHGTSSVQKTPTKPKADSSPETRAAQIADAETAACSQCKGFCSKGFSRWLQPVLIGEKLEYALCKFGQERLFSREFAQAGIPEKFHSKTFVDYIASVDNNEGKRIAREIFYAKNPKNGYFYGGIGTGKTFLAALVAQDFVRDFKTVRFLQEPADDFTACDLVVLDAIDTWTPTKTASILNRCYDKGQLFIATASCALEELALDAKTKSRLKATTTQAFFGRRNSK